MCALLAPSCQPLVQPFDAILLNNQLSDYLCMAEDLIRMFGHLIGRWSPSQIEKLSWRKAFFLQIMRTLHWPFFSGLLWASPPKSSAILLSTIWLRTPNLGVLSAEDDAQFDLLSSYLLNVRLIWGNIPISAEVLHFGHPIFAHHLPHLPHRRLARNEQDELVSWLSRLVLHALGAQI